MGKLVIMKNEREMVDAEYIAEMGKLTLIISEARDLRKATDTIASGIQELVVSPACHESKFSHHIIQVKYSSFCQSPELCSGLLPLSAWGWAPLQTR